jgi:hypothetical protein
LLYLEELLMSDTPYFPPDRCAVTYSREDHLSLLRIEAPHFVAGVVIDQWDMVVRAAPILHWAVGKPGIEIRRYCKRKGWEAYLA